LEAKTAKFGNYSLHFTKYEPTVNKNEVSILQSKTIYVRDFKTEPYTAA